MDLDLCPGSGFSFHLLQSMVWREGKGHMLEAKNVEKHVYIYTHTSLDFEISLCILHKHSIKMLFEISNKDLHFETRLDCKNL